jgi:hypothetical protein
MEQAEVERFVTSLANVECDENLGYQFFYVGDWHMIPFVSIAETGNLYESISKLDRDGVFRINIGVNPATFKSLFAGVDLEKVDFSVLDTFLPHPHYSAQSFICILNPSEKNADQLKKFIHEAHDLAAERLKLRQT